jgi:hypothetical protein
MPPIVTMLLGFLAKFGGLLSGINFGALFSGLWTSLTTYWKYWLVGALIALNLGTAYEWHHTSELLTKEKAAHQLDITNFKNAQKAADDKAQAIKTQLQTESKAAKNEADTNYTTLLKQYDTSLLRYATGTGHSKGPSDNQLPAAQGSNGPSESPNLPATLTITGDDGQVCAENTARLSAAHDWALQQLQAEKSEPK